LHHPAISGATTPVLSYNSAEPIPSRPIPDGVLAMTNIGRYQVLAEIRKGGMGIVYKAFDPLFERELAIKTMFDQTSDDPNFRARFFREAKSAGKLKHPNIVTVYDLGEENGRPYLVMEFLEGRDLRAVIHEGEPPTLEERLRIMLDICRGLSHAHSREVIHRDIKPSNIFITTAGEVKILDFGLARTLSTITKSSELLGTPNYMSPEQWNREADHRSDIFAAGAVFYEMLTLKMAFGGDTFQNVMFRILNSEPEPIERMNAALPVELSAIVSRALAKDPDRRYQSIDEVARDLESFRLTLDGRTSRVKRELEEAIRLLSAFVDENKRLLRENGSNALENLDQPDNYLGLLALRDRVVRDLSVLKALATKRQELAPLFSEAVEHERCGRLDSAVAILEKIIQEDPDNVETVTFYEDLNDRVEELRLQREREIQVAECFQQAQSRYDADDLSGCMASLEKILHLHPTHSAALALRVAATKILEGRAEAMRLRAEGLVASARARVLSGDLTGAREALDEVLQLDPGNPAASNLAQEVQQKLAERAAIEDRRRRAEAALSATRKALGLADFKAARDEVEIARSLCPEVTGIDEAIEEIDRAEDKKNRLERIAVLLVHSQQALRVQNFEEAGVQVREALLLDPRNEDARALLARIDHDQEETGRRVKIDALLVQSEEALAGGDFQEAAIRAREVLLLDARNLEATGLLDRIHKVQEERLQHVTGTRNSFRSAALWILAGFLVLAVVLTAVAPIRRVWWPGPARQYEPIAREAFNRGQYDEANRILDLWLKKDTQNYEAGMLRSQSTEVLNNLKVFESAVAARNYLPARTALVRVQELNKLDPGLGNYWSTLEAVFSPEFQDEFLGGLDLWSAPGTWRVDRGKLIVRGSDFGTLKGKYYEDLTASFNLSFLNAKGAVWILRAASDLKGYYMCQLTGPRGTPPNSFACFKVIDGKRESVLSPIPVGANLGRKDDQFNMTVKVAGDTIEHLIEVVSEPAEGPRLLGKVTDPAFSGGTLGFGGPDGEEFVVRSLKILPIRKSHGLD
jgi:serine/threonine protein kinase